MSQQIIKSNLAKKEKQIFQWVSMFLLEDKTQLRIKGEDHE